MPTKCVLVLNCGSSSLKFAIIAPDSGRQYLSGLAECFHLTDARIKWQFSEQKYSATLGAGGAHQAALDFIVNTILKTQPQLAEQLVAIGHRIVHGGEQLVESTVINETVLEKIKQAIPFAPLHNPVHLIGIHCALKSFPHLSHANVAVFDTAFHQTLAEAAYLYPLPYSLYQEHGIRRYGAHGTSHYYVTQQAAKYLDIAVDKINLISCHLGNGGSVTAVCGGRSVDTSMGLTPLEGIVMGTRSGDIDPAIIFYLQDSLGMTSQQVNTLLTQESGLLGLTGVSSDCRYIEDNYHIVPAATRAMEVYCHRLAKYIASYTTLIEGRLDALIFTGGIGENSILVRKLTLEKLTLLNLSIDDERNQRCNTDSITRISPAESIAVLVIKTNEEQVIAEDAARLTA